MTAGDPEIIHNARINLGENYLAMNDLAGARDMLEGTWQDVKKPGISYTRWRYKTRRLTEKISHAYKTVGAF